MPSERPFGVEAESRARNNAAIRAGLEKLWLAGEKQSATTGLLSSTSIKLETRDGGITNAVLCLAVDTVPTQRDYGEIPFDISARVSIISPNQKPYSKVPFDIRELRENEWASRQIRISPHDAYNKVSTYVATAPNHQQEGLAKALMQLATENLARFVILHYRKTVPEIPRKTQIQLTDQSSGREGLVLDKFGYKTSQTVSGFTAVNDLTHEKWIEV